MFYDNGVVIFIEGLGYLIYVDMFIFSWELLSCVVFYCFVVEFYCEVSYFLGFGFVGFLIDQDLFSLLFKLSFFVLVDDEYYEVKVVVFDFQSDDLIGDVFIIFINGVVVGYCFCMFILLFVFVVVGVDEVFVGEVFMFGVSGEGCSLSFIGWFWLMGGGQVVGVVNGFLIDVMWLMIGMKVVIVMNLLCLDVVVMFSVEVLFFVLSVMGFVLGQVGEVFIFVVSVLGCSLIVSGWFWKVQDVQVQGVIDQSFIVFVWILFGIEFVVVLYFDCGSVQGDINVMVNFFGLFFVLFCFVLS